MNQSDFNNFVKEISAKLKRLEAHRTAITDEFISEKIDQLVATTREEIPNFEISEEDIEGLNFHVGNVFNVRVGESAIALFNPDVERWFDAKKSEIEWIHWPAYKSMLEDQGRASDIIDANESVINDILDYSGDPTLPGPWSRKGLVMGNVQSGKTQNYIGLINKAIDCKYKTIILLGGHLNDLRKQTQERVDEGVLGKESRHLADNQPAKPTGVGVFHQDGIPAVNTGTTTMGDFTKGFAGRLGFRLTGADPVIFTIKKHTGVMKRLSDWIQEQNYLKPAEGKKLDGPLLLIDDEADYASINTKHHKDEVTKTNEYIRELLSLFHRNTYVGYTATPFANIFIEPDTSSASENDDLFPSDFMIKMPVPDNYVGQEFFFGQSSGEELEQGELTDPGNPAVVQVDDHGDLYQLKKDQSIDSIPDSLKDAIRAFVLVVAIRSLRGEGSAHNTMLVNISHLTVHQGQLEALIDDYRNEIYQEINAFAGLGVEKARRSGALRRLEETFNSRFSVKEGYVQVFQELRAASARIKVWAVNQSKGAAHELNYSTYQANGLCVIVIGGHKLSRGLTLEGLSVSYFARNSKAYDTLMQMCRWFGYRPRYKDLCRVYLPLESIRWYSFIASAIKELYLELELMSRKQQTPKEFGLKVREHPGAMIITAKNKIGWAETEVRSQDLWGQVQRRFRFWSDPERNQRNLDYAKSFLEGLRSEREGTDAINLDKDTGALILGDVDYSRLIEFIESMDLPEDDLGNRALINHLKKMDSLGLKKPRVVFFNQKSSTQTKWENRLEKADKDFVNTTYTLVDGIKTKLAKRIMKEDSQGVYKVRSVHLGNSDDEKLFISSAARQAVVAEGGSVSFDYICSDERDYPGLLIYLFAVSVTPESPRDGEAQVRLGHGRKPTLGYTVSLPRSDNLRGMSQAEIREIIKKTKHSVLMNKVAAQLREIGSYEEFEDEDDE